MDGAYQNNIKYCLKMRLYGTSRLTDSIGTLLTGHKNLTLFYN